MKPTRPEKQAGWQRFWETLMVGAMLAAIISDVLDFKAGYYACAAVALVGFIGWETLRMRPVYEDRVNRPSKGDIDQS